MQEASNRPGLVAVRGRINETALRNSSVARKPLFNTLANKDTRIEYILLNLNKGDNF